MVPELEITNRKSTFPRQPSGLEGPKSGGGSLPVDVSAAELVELELELASLADVSELDSAALVVLESSAVAPGSSGDVGPAPKLDAPGGPGLHAEARAVHSASGGAWRMPRLYPLKCGGGPLAPRPQPRPSARVPSPPYYVALRAPLSVSPATWNASATGPGRRRGARGDHATELTQFSLPRREERQAPEAASQMRTVLAWLAEARRRPSGDHGFAWAGRRLEV